MNIIPGHLFCFVFSLPPDSKMLPQSDDNLKWWVPKEVHLFPGMVVVSVFAFERNPHNWQESCAHMAIGVTTSVTPSLEECLFLEILTVEIVP